MMEVFDPRVCELGEGPLWHPERGELFWFDIIGKRLLSRRGEETAEWQFDEHVSAAGWVDRDRLLMASETGLWVFDIASGQRELAADLEAESSVTRSNDGRADPYGGFWIGTMGKRAEPGAGSIYRYYRGEVTKLFGDITISNGISFNTDGKSAFFTDTATRQVMRVGLDRNGFPAGAPEVFVDLRADALNPDGAVVDAEGNLWIAQWGASRIACYGPDGAFEQAISLPASQASCPAFGGPDLSTLFVTTAAEGLKDERGAGLVYTAAAPVTGQREHQVIL